MLILALFGLVSSVSGQTITACPGDNVTLTCTGHLSVSIEAVEWLKLGHDDKNVFLWRGDDRPDVENQHPSFEDRVELVDPQMKNNNVSVIIKNVTVNDSGTYECHIYNGTMDPSITNSSFGTRPTKTFTLVVPGDGHTAGGEEGGGRRKKRECVDGPDDDHSSMDRRLLALIVLVPVAAVCYWFCKNHYSKAKKNEVQNSNNDDKEEESMM